jgi:hypothetical protein
VRTTTVRHLAIVLPSAGRVFKCKAFLPDREEFDGIGVVCAEVAVDGKTNEITMLPGLLDQKADPGEVLITADALHAQ